jgi:hypothetical protein
MLNSWKGLILSRFEEKYINKDKFVFDKELRYFYTNLESKNEKLMSKLNENIFNYFER